MTRVRDEIATLFGRLERGGSDPDVAGRLRGCVKAILEENDRMKRGVFQLEEGQTSVTAPEEFSGVFDAAQRVVHGYFSAFRADPARGKIDIAGQRYVLVSASAMSVDFFRTIQQLYSDRDEAEAFAIGQRLLFDLAHAIGMSDARVFHNKAGLREPVEKLSAGPVHFAYSGWAYVDIKPESRPAPDETFFLAYDHPYSFEADSWLEKGIVPVGPACIMNAGYSSGWCEESFGIELTAVELTCRARGDAACSFVMAPPERIGRYLPPVEAARENEARIRVPEFFETKNVEEQLRIKEARYRELFAHMSDCVLVLEAVDGGRSFRIRDVNEKTLRVERSTRDDLVGRSAADLFPGPGADRFTEVLERVFSTRVSEEIPATLFKDQWVNSWREAFVYRLPSGEVVVVYRDVTRRMTMEEAFRRMYELTDQIIDSAPFALVVVNLLGFIQRVNRVACTILGVPSEKIVGETLDGFLAKEKLIHINELSFETNIRRSDGTEVPVLLSVLPTTASGRQVKIYSFVDLSERQHLESQLRHAQKLEAVGQLAAGIAHEINTPAQFVGDSIHFIRESFDDLLRVIEWYRGTLREKAAEGDDGLLARMAAADE